MEILPIALIGTAGEWYRNAKQDIKTFGTSPLGGKEDSFVYQFMCQFAGPEKQYEWNRLLRSLKQKAGVPVGVFANEWRKLHKRADPSGLTNEITKVNDFIGALRPDIRTNVTMQMPRTLNDAIAKAKAVEAALSLDEQGNVDREWEERLRNLELVTSKAFLTQPEQTQTRIICNLCNQPGHKAEFCRTRTMNLQKRLTGTCFNCNQQGHMAKQCPNKKIIKCFGCGKTGHTQNNCWQKNGTGPNNQNRNMQFQGKRIINGKPVRVFYAEDDEEADTQLQLAEAINQLTTKLNLKV